MSPTVIALMLTTSLFAGWVDAVVGGGGLILLPLMMILNPSFTYAQALGVNKIAAICGTGSSAITMARRVPAARTAFRYAPLAFGGSALGAIIASSVDKDIMRPIVIVLLVTVGAFVLLRPSFGQVTVRRTVTRGRWVVALVLITGLGIYDGAFGPGTGLFLILTVTSLLGEDFLNSAAWAKILNTFTNLGALVIFAINGDIWWLLGFGLAVTNIVGAQIGARMVLSKGAGFVRIVLLVVVVLMAGKLALDQFSVAG